MVRLKGYMQENDVQSTTKWLIIQGSSLGEVGKKPRLMTQSGSEKMRVIYYSLHW